MAPAAALLFPLVRWRALAIASVSCLALGASLAALAQDSSLRAERVVSYVTRKNIPLSAKVGPVSIQSVEFTDRGRGSTPSGLAGIVRGGSSPETSTTIRAHFLVENPSTDEWAMTFTLEFLDKSGKLIDKATRKASWEGEAKPLDFDHLILQYVVPSIAQVRIVLEGRLD
jgi:hypothetical protein